MVQDHPRSSRETTMGTDLLTLEEAAERLRTSPSTLRYWRHRSEGPKSFRVGRRVLYKRSDLDAWVEQQYAAENRPVVA
ncbi:helix-turn-helix transcriptional regulator [Modestobacter sp. SYSU DS0875]